MKDEHYYAVIMAGGGGTRLWPLSRQAHPKQMLRLIDDRSLFQTSVERLRDIFPLENIYVVTVATQALELQEQCPGIPKENFLLEPEPRGTASVIGLAAVALKHRDPQAVMAVLTSDHYIGNEAHFRNLLQIAYQVAREGKLVTLGINPSYAATGYGYIQRGTLVGAYEGVDVYQVLRFKEKPDELQAQLMLVGGDHTWNSGMFIWQVERIMQEFSRQMPELASSLAEIDRSWQSPQREQVISTIWPQIKAETIDYGVMENARDVVVIPTKDLHWSDVGSWDSLFDVLPADPNGNIVIGGQHFALDTKESLIYVAQQRRLIVTIGVRDLVVVDTGDVLLVCRKDEAQKVRHVVNVLKETQEGYI
jgi:mannose-1-phosphate guanylyltransferase